MGNYPDYVQRSIDRLKSFEPPEGYFVAFSGGKDSQCIYHLCEMAGVKFDAHYSITTVDPPELVQFIRDRYPDVKREINHYDDGTPITMWNLIPRNMIPPTRIMRYCCSALKECNGEGHVVVTGVRWAESANRKAKRGVVDVRTKTKRLTQMLEAAGADYKINSSGAIMLNDDNDISRRMVEQCYRTNKTMVNPIVDWTEDQVWKFLREVRQVESCGLYQEGFHRLGCIGCPMARRKGREREFAMWPKYESMYMRAFARMIQAREKAGKKDGIKKWNTPQEVMDWWMNRGILPGQIRMDEYLQEGTK